MKEEEKEILKHIVKKELEEIKEKGEDVIFPSLKFLESIDVYERTLKEILEELEK